MIRIFLTLLALAIGSSAWAQTQEFPALFRVTGVAASDVLNVRAGPGVSHEIIGSLAPNAVNVEVIGTNQDQRWGRVSMGEFSGWASMRFLTRTGPDWNAGLPTPLYCHGAEPFWSFERLIGGGNWSDFDVQNQPHAELWSGTAQARGPSNFAIELDSGVSSMTAFIRRGICSDGMSDRDFGMVGQFLRRANGQTYLLDGCCALVR